MVKKYDAYIAVCKTQDELMAEVIEMEDNSIWMPSIPRNALKTIPLDGPIYAADAAKKYGLDMELCVDTATNPKHGGDGTNLLLQYQGKTWCLRDTGRQTLYTTAGMLGPANANMVRAEAFAEFSDVLNTCLKYAKGSALLLIRYGKVSALHSGASDGYAVMPISELLRTTVSTLEKNFGKLEYKEGSNSHSYTYALWDLPEAQGKLVDAYQKALAGAVSRNHAIDWMPCVRFSTSDTATSSAMLVPKFKPSSGGLPFTIGKGVKVEHSIRPGKFGLEKYQEEAEKLYALFMDGAEKMKELGELEIHNPVNCLVGICSDLKIPRKYADPAREEIETFTYGSPTLSALDIYLSIAQIPAHAKAANASDNKVLELEEMVAKTLFMRWTDYDVGGVVKW